MGGSGGAVGGDAFPWPRPAASCFSCRADAGLCAKEPSSPGSVMGQLSERCTEILPWASRGLLPAVIVSAGADPHCYCCAWADTYSCCTLLQ